MALNLYWRLDSSGNPEPIQDVLEWATIWDTMIKKEEPTYSKYTIVDEMVGAYRVWGFFDPHSPYGEGPLWTLTIFVPSSIEGDDRWGEIIERKTTSRKKLRRGYAVCARIIQQFQNGTLHSKTLCSLLTPKVPR